MSARFISKMNSACQTNSQNLEDEMFLNVVFKQALHPQQTPYIFMSLPLRTKTNLMSSLCKHFAVLPKSFCVSALNNNYEPPFPETDVLNWL